MKLTQASTLPQVAVIVGEQLARGGIRAVLTGGACVAFYTGTYTSKDPDFVRLPEIPPGSGTQTRGLTAKKCFDTIEAGVLFWPVT